MTPDELEAWRARQAAKAERAGYFVSLERAAFLASLKPKTAKPKAPRKRRASTRPAGRPSWTRSGKPETHVIVKAYEAGDTMDDLAARYGVHPKTIWRHLHAGGATMRRPGEKAVRG